MRWAMLALLLPGAALAQSPHPASLASAFVDSVGINGSGSATTDAPLLAFTGIRHVRVQAGVTGDTAAQLGAYSTTGAKLLVMQAYCFCSIPASGAGGEASWLSTYVDPAASVVEAIAGPNEIVLGPDPDSYNGVGIATGSGAASYQAALYSAAKADPEVSSLPVLTYTLGIGISPSGFGVGSNADVDDRHCYAANTASAAATVSYCLSYSALASGAPMWMTEAGMSTVANPSQGVDDTTQARFDLRFLLYAFTQGVVRTYLYNLRNYGDDGYSGGAPSADFNAYFGAFRSNGIPKVLANTLRNVINVVGGSAAFGTLTSAGSLSYALTGMPGASYSLLLQEPGPPPGVWDLVLWRDGDSWNNSTGQPQSLGSASVTLTLATSAGSIGVFDPIVSPGAVQSVAAASSITVSLADDPLVLKIGPAIGGRLAAAPVRPLFRAEKSPL